MAHRSSNSERRRRALRLALLCAALHACSCRARKQERIWSLCTCDYVTDMDYPGKVSFEVCGEPPGKSDVAKSCALNSGVGAVLECACRAESRGPCRDSDRCRDVDR
jgi:hypothetical protein